MLSENIRFNKLFFFYKKQCFCFLLQTLNTSLTSTRLRKAPDIQVVSSLWCLVRQSPAHHKAQIKFTDLK